MSRDGGAAARRDRGTGDRLFRAAVVFALAVVCYSGNGRTMRNGDTVSARYLPFSILQRGSFLLDEFPFVYKNRGSYWARRIDGHWTSVYPVGAAIAALPFYAHAVWGGTVVPGTDDCLVLEKVAASAIVALSVVFLYLALARVTTPALTVALTIAYALGTSSLSVSSQGLWQHGPAQMSLALGLLLLVEGRARSSPRLLAWAGLPLAFAFVCRPTNLVMLPPLAAYVLLVDRRAAVGFALAASLPLLFQLGYNLAQYGTPIWLQFPLSDQKRWRAAPIDTLASLLFSPGRGLFIYSPFLLFAIAGLALEWRRGGDGLVRAIGVGVAISLALHSRWWNWWGGATFGPRLMADLTPLLVFAIHPCAAALGPLALARFAFAAAVVWSIVAHGVGAYWDGGGWNNKLHQSPPRVALWRWTDNQLVNGLGEIGVGALDRLGLRTVPLDPDVEPRMRARAERELRHDLGWTRLRDAHRRAGDEAGAEGVEQIRRAQFTPTERVDWQFEDQLTLVGIDRRTVLPSEIEITYYLRAERQMFTDYAIHARLVGDGCWQQNELPLGVPDHPTSHWMAGETFKAVQRWRLPSEIPPKGCRLQVGVWSPEERRTVYIRRWPVWKRRATLLTIPPSFTREGSTAMCRRQ